MKNGNKFETAVVSMHWNTGLSLNECESILKGTGIAPYDEED